MERMGDILARSARIRARRERLNATQITPSAEAQTQPTRPAPSAAHPGLRQPAPDVAHRAAPPADTLDSERILELPRVSPRPARATGPLAAPVAPVAPALAGESPAPRRAAARTQPLSASRRISAGSSGMLALGEATQAYVHALRPAGSSGTTSARNARPAKARPDSDDPAVCPLCHGAGYVRLDVPFGDPSFGQAVACACKERALEDRRLSDLRRMSSLDAFHDKTFATFETALPGVREALEVARRYAEDPNGWLVLSGGYGVGKTHLAAAIAHERLANGQSVFFSIVPDLLDHLRAAFAPSSEMPYDELFDKVREAGVLVLDDLGAENATAWATEKLFQIINYRYNYRMPTVITTNHRLLSHMDERIRSRLSDRSFVRNVAIDSADYRERHAGRGRQSGQSATRAPRNAYQR